MDSSPSVKGYDGLTVAAFESRMAAEMTRLIRTCGGVPLVAPSMQEIPLEDNSEALVFGERVLNRTVDMVLLLTGVGTRTLLDIWKTRYSLDTILAALNNITILVRGPKPLAVVKGLGILPQLVVPEPNTWQDVLETLDRAKPEGLKGLVIGIQEYGASNQNLLDGLTQRGATILRCPVYRWALPDDLEPLRTTLSKILKSEVDVLLLTNAVQLDHIMDILESDHQVDRFRESLGRVMVASIGQITSERLRGYNLPVDFEPSHPKMGILVNEASRYAKKVLKRKRGE